MGVLSSPLPKPVDSILVGRRGASSFQIGVAGMNGWRPSMEDAHVIHVGERCGFFGVFDGHGGSECAEFLARRLEEELETGGIPEDDEAVTALMLGLDEEFLDSSMRGGSTGTFAIIEQPAEQEGGITLRIGNTGDSRVLLGHSDGSIFQGPGTDLSLTTDHKPDLPSERQRIERTEHKVLTSADGLARIGGNLTVSRAFGDRRYKQSPGLALEEQAVCANPEFGKFSCDAADFVVLMCDGICEGQFSNAEVVSFAASQLQEHGDPGKAAAAVCRKALAESSRDNLTCMIVLLSGGELSPETEFLPGTFAAPEHEGFKFAYKQAAEAGNLSLGEALEKRYDLIKQELLGSLAQERRQELEHEIERYQCGPPLDLAVGTKERAQWFEDFTEKNQHSSDIWSTIMSMSHQNSRSNVLPVVRPRSPTALRLVKVPSEEVLRPAISNHSALKWEPRMEQACNAEAQVIEDDATDGTSMVQYGPGFSTKAWLPTAVLIEV